MEIAKRTYSLYGLEANLSCKDLVGSIANKAGPWIKEAFHAPKELQFKGEVDLVTETDQKVEAMVMATIKEKYPAHAFVGEETVSSGKGKEELTDEPTWIVDPIDGTTNFVSRVPHLAISIGFAIKKQVVVGVVYNPVLDEMYVAVRGCVAYKNGASITSSPCTTLKNAVVATGVDPYDRTDENLSKVLGTVKKVLQHVRALRRLGSAALDMCYVACGMFEAYYEKGVHAWDIAAGSLILEEAGGKCDSMDGSPFNLCTRQVVATTAPLRDLFLPLVQEKH